MEVLSPCKAGRYYGVLGGTKQNCVARSSTEAEYIGQSEGALQVEYVRHLLEELGIEGTIPVGPTVLHADNQGAIKLQNLTFGMLRSYYLESVPIP